MPASPFTAAERAVFRRLTTPARIQQFVDELIYNQEPHGHTCRSPRRVLRDRTAHCMEGALFAAAALRLLGHPPLLFDLEAVRDDDHVLALFRVRGHWGAIAKSNYSGLRFREPVYRNLRELAISYFEHYYNPRGEKTLRAYSRPLDLRPFDRIPWMTTEEDVWAVPERLCVLPHRQLLDAAQIRGLSRMDRRLYDAGRFGAVAGLRPRQPSLSEPLAYPTSRSVPASTLGEGRDPKEAIVALKGNPLPGLHPADPQRVVASIHYGGHGEQDPGAQHTLQVAADHVGQLTENVAHHIVHRIGRIHGEEASREAAGLAPVALQQHRSIPIARQVDCGGQSVRTGKPGPLAPGRFYAQHGCEYRLHDLRQLAGLYL
jgi:hypothetical protein